MGRYGAPKRVRCRAAELPDDLVHVIFSKLDFKSKVIAGQVCKKWDQMLKAPIVGARHWALVYNIDTAILRQAFNTADQIPIVEAFNATIGRWLINRAAAIEVVHVAATLSSDQEGVATRNVLASQLPMLVGCLGEHVNTLTLSFQGGSPFESPRLFSSAFLTLLCPMVKTLTLCCMMIPIDADQFAAICELTSLEGLSIDAWTSNGDTGLQEMTSDISKLVNLTTLYFRDNVSVDSIPESISCLQKLEVMDIQGSSINELPASLARLAKLSSLTILGTALESPLRFPPSLQGLESLSSVSLPDCSLESIPKMLTGLSALTYLNVSQNKFASNEGWPWWPTTLSRLTKLAALDIHRSFIGSLPPHISRLHQLTMLNVGDNDLRSLPEQLSSLQNLRVIDARGNRITMVPVSVLSSLTALTSISLRLQCLIEEETFHISSSLLPILHPGLVELDLTQSGQWDSVSLCHLGRAVAAVANRRPVPTLKFLT